MRSISRLHRRAAIFLAASTLLGAGFAHAADPVKIGYLIPLSGSAAASIGKDMSRATHLAIKHINEAGGIKSMGGAPLELVEVDSRGDAKVAITEVERLITREKTPVLLGAFQSGVTFPATAVAEKNRTPWVVEISRPRPTSPNAASSMCSVRYRCRLRATPTAWSTS